MNAPVSLYHYPDIYAALFAPEPSLCTDVRLWIERHLDRSLTRLMDPACGPGNWLWPFATRGVHVAGNDRVPQMVAAARHRLQGVSHEIVQGDMRALNFATGPFDVALSLDASIGHLPDRNAMAEHLTSVHEQLGIGGLYIVGLVIADRDQIDDSVELLHEWPPTPIASGGHATLRLDSLCRDPIAGQETIRFQLHTNGVAGCPEHVQATYVLRTLSIADLDALLDRVGGFEVLAAHSMDDPGRADLGLYPNCGEVTLILRKHQSSSSMSSTSS